MELDEQQPEQNETAANPQECKNSHLELEATKISAPESNSMTIMAVGDDSTRPGHNVETMTVQMTSPATAGQQSPSARITVKIVYPKGYKGIKHLPDDSIREVSLETADQFVKAGIASIINPDKPE
jgi:hypothetical protein